MGFITEIRGIPPANLLQTATRRDLFFDENNYPLPSRDHDDNLLKPNSKSLAHYIGPEDRNFMKFVDACLHWDPDMRMTPDEALRHDWILEGIPEDIQNDYFMCTYK
jgi:dual specificity tyrosine-phosphorylation-regulated kinase 2/3/4